ncbi:transketolase [Raoultella ornithinolytica]|nr:transketolase [Raoultella ornithinolytica]
MNWLRGVTGRPRWAAAHYGLDNLIIINDKNNLQLAGPTREIMNTDPLAEKWQAFGMTVTECQGNNMASVVADA